MANVSRDTLSLIVLTGLLAGLSGCSFVAADKPPAEVADLEGKRGEAPAVRRVRFGGEAMVLGEADQPACTPRELVGAVEDLLRDDKRLSARLLIQQFPDVAREILLDAAEHRATPGTLERIAAAHDQLEAAAAGPPGWQALIADRGARPDVYAEWDARRHRMLTDMQSGRVEQAASCGITETPAGVPSRMLDIEAWYLQGLALMLAERNGEAVAALDRAVEKAWARHPYEAARLLLLLSECRRRAGDPQGATESWTLAVRRAVALAVQDLPVRDPILWERIAYLRPIEQGWPLAGPDGLETLAHDLGLSGSGPPRPSAASAPQSADDVRRGELLVWAFVGTWRLQRGETQAALVALKRAETAARAAADVSRLRLAQARALLAVEQVSPARALLLQLASLEDPRQAKPAMAVLGTLLLQQGATVQGQHLLQRAVEEQPAVPWPERPQAEADLGLACLLTGSEPEGLRWLESARQKMASAGDWLQLIQCLENEAAFHHQQDRDREAQDMSRQIRELETRGI